MKYRQSTFNVYPARSERGCQMCQKISNYYISSKDGFLCTTCYGNVQTKKQVDAVTPSRKLVRKGKNA